MPLMRVELRNEYGMGAPELYTGANKEDPKEVLEGVSVAGLVGILRQLGDLAEFSAEVFHGLQEQLMVTSSRSQKLMVRVKQIEAALPPLEKLVLAQRSHLHFAYTAGANWHVRRRCEQSHFIYSDLPRFVQDSYEQCREPPRLNLLDKFDQGGRGSCLKRYSDPSFFRRASTGSEVAYSDKFLKDKKGRKIKKRRSGRKNGEVSRAPSMSSYGQGVQFASLNMGGHSSRSERVSTLKSDLADQPISLDSRNGSFDFECVSYPRSSTQPEEPEFKESSSSSSRMQNNDSHDFSFGDGKGAALFDDIQSSLSGEQTGPSSFSVTWNEKAEMLKPASVEYIQNGIHRNFNPKNEEMGSTHLETGEGYRHEKFSEKLSTTIDLDNEGATRFETSEGFGHEMSLEAFSTNTDLENMVRCTEFNTGEGYDDNEYLVTFLGNIDRQTEKIGDARSKAAKGYNCDEPLQTFSETHDLETSDRGANHFGTAMEYDHDESLETFPTNRDQEIEESGAIQFRNANQMDIQLDNENLSMWAPDDIQLVDFESETVEQKNCHLDNGSAPVSTSADLQHEDAESETDNYVDALNSIESDYYTDLDGQTKQEMEHYSDTECKAINHGVDTLINSKCGSNPSNSESSIVGSSSLNDNLFEVGPNMLPEAVLYGSPGEVTSEDMVPFEPHVAPQPAEIANESKNPHCHIQFLNPIFEVSPNPMLPKAMLYGSPDKVTSQDMVPFESHVAPQPVEIANESSNPRCRSDFDSLKPCDALGSSNVNSVTNNVLASNSRQHESTDMTVSSFSDLQKPPPEPSSSMTSIKFWTNGGLLGLEPSKPPDCSMLNVFSQESVTRTDSEISTSVQKPEIRDKNPENNKEAPIVESTSCQGDIKGGILTKKAPWSSVSADLSVNLQKLSYSFNDSNSNSSQKDCIIQNTETVLPVTPDIDSTWKSQGKSGNSSRMFELGNRFLLNGFYQKSLLDKDETSNQTSSSNDSAFQLKSNHKHVESRIFSAGSMDMLGSRCPISSPSSSPPLGHMKMSFPPVNGFEAPKLQLKFPDGNVNYESGRDMFPSFQLVPEPTVPVHDVGSDSDDDTFYRSSPSGSDCPSHRYDSNSEQWECSESPRSKDQELCDAFCRISLTESVSTSWETGATTQGEMNNNSKIQSSFTRHSSEQSQSGYLVDLPGLESIHHSLEEEWRIQCDSKDHSDPRSGKELTPSPPPPPPPQWRSTKSQIELEEDIQVSPAKNLSNEFDWKLGHTISQQPKPAPVRQEQIIQAACTLKTKAQDLQNIRVKKKVNQSQSANRKEMEEKEDFLQQIKTKSFSLRRTEIAKASVPTGTSTSLQVNAILHKAKAIRQAVASDDGEDDNWSDT